MMNYSENKLFKEVFYSNLPAIRQVLADGNYDKNLMIKGFEYVGYEGSIMLPLYYLTLAQRILFLPIGYKTDMVITGKKNKMALACREVLLFLKDEQGVDVDSIVHLPFYNTDDANISSLPCDCNHINNPKSLKAYLNKGYSQIDVELYRASMLFDYDKIDNLLSKGAKPDADFIIDEDEPYNFLGMAAEESCFYREIYLDKLYNTFIEKGEMLYINDEDLWALIKDAGYH